MSTSDDVAIASVMLTAAETLQSKQLGKPRATVRELIAGRVRSSPDTLRNIIRRRRKNVGNSLMCAIRDELIRTAQVEIVAIEHVISLARQTGMDPRDDALVAAQARAKDLRDILEQAAGGEGT